MKSSTEVRQVFATIRRGTIVALVVTLGSVGVAWLDPSAGEGEAVMMVSTNSTARRVFPTLGDEDSSKATVELQPAGQPLIRITPDTAGGHQLMRGETLLGTVDPEAFEDLWSSLRMGTALRPVDRGAKVRTSTRGFIRVALPHASLTLELGETLSDFGVYGRINGADEAWVIESEMQWLLDQPPEAWLARRLLPFEPGAVAQITFERDVSGKRERLVLARGHDGFWRVESGARPALLSTEAVENKLGRLLWARLDPLIEREQHGDLLPDPSVIVAELDGEPRELRLLGECPGHPDRLVVERGPGMLGCLPAELFEPWVLFDGDGGMVEGRLVPHRYGRVVQIDLVRPAVAGAAEPPIAIRSLVRRSGLWLLDGGEGQGSEPVSEDEVARWYGALARGDVVALLDPPPQEASPPGEAPPSEPPADEFVPDVELAIHADTGEVLRIRCRTSNAGEAGKQSECIRDESESAARDREGPRLRVLGALPGNLAFDAETFTAKRLIEAGPGEIRELEILAGEAEGAVRQSVEQDMGVWRLDAPKHVDAAAGALDDVRLETLLAILSSLRAETWREPSGERSLRRFQLDLLPEQGPRRTIALTLFPDCVVDVEGRSATIPEADCAVLGEDLLFDDPLRFWIEGARVIEFMPPDRPDDRLYLRKQHGRFETVDGRAADEAVDARLRGWIDWRSAGLRAGDPPTPVEWVLDVRRNDLPDVHAELGQGWVRLRGADWYYVERETKAIESPDPEKPIEFDPEAIDVP